MALTGVAFSETSTPIGKGDKHEASSSLDAAGVDSKKTRRRFEDSMIVMEAIVFGTMIVMEAIVFGTDRIKGIDDPVHVLSQ